MKIREFESEEALIQFEKERQEYYIRQLDEIHRNRLNCYKHIIQEYLTSKGRQLRKLYDNYLGGYWKDANGYIYTHNIHLLVDDGRFKSGQLAIEKHGDLVTGVYFYSNCWNQVCPDLDELIDKGIIEVDQE